MRTSARRIPATAKSELHLSNRFPELLARSGLTPEEVSRQVEELIGYRLDRRTLRRYLSGQPITDSTAVTVAALCRAVGVSLDEALELEVEDPLDALLAKAGRRGLIRAKVGPAPPGWGTPDPAWGPIVEPWLEERRGRY